jgi:hypothetical protein
LTTSYILDSNFRFFFLKDVLFCFGDSPASRFYVPKRDEVTGDWIKLNNEELHDLYSSPTIVRGDKIKKNEMGGTCSADGVRRCVYTVLVENFGVKRPLGRPRRRLEDNIKADL